jgi:hypothetical protein
VPAVKAVRARIVIPDDTDFVRIIAFLRLRLEQYAYPRRRSDERPPNRLLLLE